MTVELRGGNLAYVEMHLPHLTRLLVEQPEELYEHASLLVLGNDIANDLNLKDDFKGQVIDLRRDLTSAQR